MALHVNNAAGFIIDPDSGANIPVAGGGTLVVTGNPINAISTSNSGGNLEIDLHISPIAGNQLTVLPTGLYVTPTVVFDDQVFTATNTPTVNITLTPTPPSGPDNQVNYGILANVNISTTAGNQVSILPDGLYVPALTSTALCTAFNAVAAGVASVTDSLLAVDTLGNCKKVTVSSVLSGTTNVLSIAGPNLTSTVNGIASSVLLSSIVSPSNVCAAINATVAGVQAVGDKMLAVDTLGNCKLILVPSNITTNVLTNPVNTMTSTVNGVSSSATVVNSNVLNIAGANLTSTVNGVVASIPLTSVVTSTAVCVALNAFTSGPSVATDTIIAIDSLGNCKKITGTVVPPLNNAADCTNAPEVIALATTGQFTPIRPSKKQLVTNANTTVRIGEYDTILVTGISAVTITLNDRVDCDTHTTTIKNRSTANVTVATATAIDGVAGATITLLPRTFAGPAFSLSQLGESVDIEQDDASGLVFAH